MARTAVLDAIRIYPVKGLRGIAVRDALVEPWGLAGDRRWMVVDAAHRYLTQREVPGMARIAAMPDEDGGLTLSAPGGDAAGLRVPVPDAGGPAVEVVVWRDRVRARTSGPDADAWLSAALGRACRLVHMDDPATARPVDPAYGRPDDRVSFADGYPLLVATAASLDDLNARLARPVPMARFRPNLVVSGPAPWTEDGWRRLRVGEVAFRAVKPCARCAVVAVDQDTGERARDGEPLRALAAFRRDARGRVVFGQNLVPDGGGRIAAGDRVEVLESGPVPG